MNLKAFFIFLPVFVCTYQGIRAQLSITTDTIIQSSLCAGANVIIPYKVTGGSYDFGNMFTAQLSETPDPFCMTGEFSNPIDIGSFYWWNSGYIMGTIPVNTTLGFYRIRVISSSPASTGTLSPNCVIISNLPQLAVTILATPGDTVCQGDSITLSVAPIPAASYLWSTGEKTPSINVGQSGAYTVTVIDTFGCETKSDPYEVFVEICTGMDESRFARLINLYPNPVTNLLIVEFGLAKSSTLGIHIQNVLGEIVLETKDEFLAGSARRELNMAQLPRGLYFVRIESDGQSVMRKAVKL